SGPRPAAVPSPPKETPQIIKNAGEKERPPDDLTPVGEIFPEAPPIPAPQREASSPAAHAKEEASIDVSVAWDKIASDYSKSLIYRWLASGIFQQSEGGVVCVVLPPSSKEGMESLIGESGRKEAEGKLADILGRKVKLQLMIGDVPEPETISDEEPEPVEVNKAPGPPAPAANPADDFKNDPLIRKALEIFAAEIQTT
ncbi:MAG: hypothetical protein WEB60_10515, partial [Terrimicrobiaceae bacterium]